MRKIVIAFAALLLVGACCWLVAVYSVFRAMKQRDADAKRAFEPLVHLRPEILDNAFGVYGVTFTASSLLSDSNVGDILSLNLLPAEYDVTLVIKTTAITDDSIPTLSSLTSIDTLIVDDAGLSANGITDLISQLPNGVVYLSPGFASDRLSDPNAPEHGG